MEDIVKALIFLATVVAPFWFVHRWVTWIRDGKIEGSIDGPNGTLLRLRRPHDKPTTPTPAPSTDAGPQEHAKSTNANLPSATTVEDKPEGNSGYAIWKPLFQAARVDRSLRDLEKTWEESATKLSGIPAGERELLEAQYFAFRIELGDETAAASLAALSTSNPTWRAPALRLAEHFRDLSRYSDAIKWCDVAIARARASGQHTGAYVVRLEAQEAQSGTDEMIAAAHSMLREVGFPETKASILAKIAATYAERELWDASACYYQMAIAENPQDLDLRFSAAFSASEGDVSDLLSYGHYRILEKVSPTKDYVLNNLANAAGNSGARLLHGYYAELARSVNPDLAEANIAIKLTEMGLTTLAMKLLEEKERVTDLNHVNAARDYIYRQKQAVAPAIEQLDEGGKLFLEFYAASGAALLKAGKPWAPPIADGDWHSNHTTLVTKESAIGRTQFTLKHDGATYQGELHAKHGIFQGWLERKDPLSLLSRHPEWLYARSSVSEGDILLLLEDTKTSDAIADAFLYRLSRKA